MVGPEATIETDAAPSVDNSVVTTSTARVPQMSERMVGPEATVETDAAPSVDTSVVTTSTAGVPQMSERRVETDSGSSVGTIVVGPLDAEDENENVLLVGNAKNPEGNQEVEIGPLPCPSVPPSPIDVKIRGKGERRGMSMVKSKTQRGSSDYMLGILGEEMSPTTAGRPTRLKLQDLAQDAAGIRKNGTQGPPESESLAQDHNKKESSYNSQKE